LRHDGEVPVPMSEAAQDTSACPFDVSTMRTATGICNASHTPVAMPQPPAPCHRASSAAQDLRLLQPKASARAL